MEIEALTKHEVSWRLDKMRKLVVANPNDPTIMFNYADALIKNGETYEGIAIMLETVQRWPEQYRVWWSLGWALNRHAWQVRGNSVWREVPKRAQQEFTALSLLADKVVDKALELNPRRQAFGT